MVSHNKSAEEIEQALLDEELGDAALSVSVLLQQKQNLSAIEIEAILKKYHIFASLVFSNFVFEENNKRHSAFARYKEVFEELSKQNAFHPYMVWQEIIEHMAPDTTAVYPSRISYMAEFIDKTVKDHEYRTRQEIKITPEHTEQVLSSLYKKIPVKALFCELFTFPSTLTASSINVGKEALSSISQLSFSKLFSDNAAQNKKRAIEYTKKYPYLAQTLLNVLAFENSSHISEFTQYNQKGLKDKSTFQIVKAILNNIKENFLILNLLPKDNWEQFKANPCAREMLPTMSKELIVSIQRNFANEKKEIDFESRPSNYRSSFFRLASYMPLIERLYQDKFLTLKDIIQTPAVLSFAYLLSSKTQEEIVLKIKEEKLQELIFKEDIYFRKFFVSPLDNFYTSFSTQTHTLTQKPINTAYFFLQRLEQHQILSTQDLFKPLSKLTRIGGLSRITPQERFYDYSFLAENWIRTLQPQEFNEKLNSLSLSDEQKEIWLANAFRYIDNFYDNSPPSTNPSITLSRNNALSMLNHFSLKELDAVALKIEKAKNNFLFTQEWQNYRIQREYQELQSLVDNSSHSSHKTSKI